MIMQIISGNIVLIQGQEGISLYVERVISCITDEPVFGAVQSALSPEEATALVHALLAASRTATAASDRSKARQAIDAALEQARARSRVERGHLDA